MTTKMVGTRFTEVVRTATILGRGDFTSTLNIQSNCVYDHNHLFRYY